MWRIPIMNLCFILVLITIVALRHSAVVFVPDKFSYESANNRGLFQKHRIVSSLGNQIQAALGNLSDMGQRSRIIKEWFLEYKNASWEILRAARGAESDLVQARFHIANAEALGAATGHKQRAKKELIRADGYLQHAVTDVASNLKPVVNAIRKEITDAKFGLEMDRPDTDINDEQIKNDLDSVIQLLRGKSLQPVSKR